MPAIGPVLLEAGDHILQYGVTAKTGVTAAVGFARRFQAPPTVVLSSWWEGRNAEVGHAETLNEVSASGFSLASDNAAADYFVSWIAIGQPEGVSRSIALRSGPLEMFYGRMNKTATFSPQVLTLSSESNVQLSPHWEGQGRGVGHAETLHFNDELRGLQAVSNNGAANYHVHYLATGTGSDFGPRNEYRVGDTLIRTGVTNKIMAAQPVAFDTAFGSLPVVVVTPFWDGQGRGVGHAETLNRVSQASFATVSGNAAPNYHVSWIAIGSAIV